MPDADLDKSRFLLTQVAAAVEVNLDTLKLWINRGVVPLAPDEQAAKERSPRRLSLRRALQITIMAELVHLGIYPSLAAQAAVAK